MYSVRFPPELRGPENARFSAKLGPHDISADRLRRIEGLYVASEQFVHAAGDHVEEAFMQADSAAHNDAVGRCGERNIGKSEREVVSLESPGGVGGG
jgi:glycerol dehydrogenase-like iron-containing ADH family enzyme